MVHLARHGQTAYNREGRFQGHLPVPLDETGRRQARELADVAGRRSWASLWSSPLLRARAGGYGRSCDSHDAPQSSPCLTNWRITV